jgi:hypothetical protein
MEALSGTAANIAVLVFAAYFVKHLIEAFSRRRQGEQEAERLICALYAEIKANTEDLSEFLQSSPAVERVKQAVAADSSFRPHITNGAHTLVYNTYLAELASLPRPVILKVVGFYAQVERLTVLIEGMDRASYEGISPEGRGMVVEEIWRAVERGATLGREVLHGLEIHAPLDLTREALR